MAFLRSMMIASRQPSAFPATFMSKPVAIATSVQSSGARFGSASSRDPATQERLQQQKQEQECREACTRLHNILEEYRQLHYTREVPLRFKKEIVVAACCPATGQPPQQQLLRQGVCRLEGLEQVLGNIGLDHRLSRQDLKVIFATEGDEKGTIPASRLVQIL